MLTIIEDQKLIAESYARFKARFDEYHGERLKASVGSRRGSNLSDVVWLGGGDIWCRFDEIGWNAFGVERPAPKKSNSIVCELNFPEYGIYRAQGGAFAKDEKGKIHVIHRGKIGGSRKGVTKEGFMSSYDGEIVTVSDGGRETSVIRIAALDSTSFLEEFSRFIRAVARYKEEAVNKGKSIGGQ
jgi:hypothetical protein